MKFTLMCGLPRSGKSTVAKQLESGGAVRVCPDDIRLALHGQQMLARAEPFVWAIAETMARALLTGGRDVVIDATNITKRRREPWVWMAREFGTEADIILIETPRSVCLARNNNSMDENVIFRMAAHYERPTCREGTLLTPVPGVGFAVVACDCARCQMDATMQRIAESQRTAGTIFKDGEP